MKDYEEVKTLSPFWGWVALIVFSILLLGFGMIAHLSIREAERTWSFWALPIAPGESNLSTYRLHRGKIPKQMHPLPEALPFTRLPTDTSSEFVTECK